jgi:hypothetical protein
LISNKVKFFAYFYGGYDEEGNSWCSDCVLSKPSLEEASKFLKDQESVSLYKFPIDDKLEWRKPTFIYRTHPKVKLQKVPTLLYYQDGCEYGRLTEGELFDVPNVLEFVKQSLE